MSKTSKISNQMYCLMLKLQFGEEQKCLVMLQFSSGKFILKIKPVALPYVVV